MKYAQAAVLACIGSAALISAIPTNAGDASELVSRARRAGGPRRGARLGTHGLAASGVPKGRAETIGGKVGGVVNKIGKFSAAAMNTNTVPAEEQGVGLTKREPKLKMPSFISKAKAPSSKLKIAGKTAGKAMVNGAGGGAAVAGAVGSTFALTQQLRQGGQPGPAPDQQMLRRELDEALAQRDLEDFDLALRNNGWNNRKTKKNGGQRKNRKNRKNHKGKGRGGRGRGKKSSGAPPPSAAPPSDAPPSDAPPSDAPPSDAPPSGSDTPVAARDFDDELVLRDLEDMLLAARDVDEDLFARGYDDGLFVRDLENEIYSRNFDEELFVRALEDELAARGWFSKWNANRKAKNAEKEGTKLKKQMAETSRKAAAYRIIADSKSGVAPPPAADPSAGGLAERHFYEDLFIRDFDEELFAREFEAFDTREINELD